MKATSSSDALSRVVNALRYSLASYLQFARPRVDDDSGAIAETISRVATSHDHGATRIGELLVERHGHAGDAEAYDLVAELVDRERRHLRILLRLLTDRHAMKSFTPVHAMPRVPRWPTGTERPKVRTPRRREPVSELVFR